MLILPLDTETTGIPLWREPSDDPRQPHLVDICAMLFNDHGVLIENRPAVEVMKAHDGVKTLHFVDPPYLHETRHIGANYGRAYRHEMNNAQHVELLETVCNLKGMVALSGYSSEIYNDLLKGWTCHSTSSRISSARGSAVRQECMWLNPSCSRSISQPGLFGELA